MLLFLTTISCNKYITQNIYQQTYFDSEIAVVDVYTHMYFYDMDSIPLTDWITVNLNTDTIFIKQHMIQKIINEKSNYLFIFSTYAYPSILYYDFIIRFYGRKKDIQKEAAKPLP